MKLENKRLYYLPMILFYMSANFAHPVTPALFKFLALPNYLFGVALACMYLGSFLFSPMWGKLNDRLSCRSVMLICCSGYGIMQVLFALCRSVWLILLVRFFAGIFVGGISVSILNYHVNTAQDEADRKSSLIANATVEGVCNAIGYFVGGMLGEIGIYCAVWVQAGCLVLSGLLFRFLCKDDRSASREKTPLSFRDVNAFRNFAQGKAFWGSLLAWLFAVSALQFFSRTCFSQSFNYYAIDQLGLGTGANGAIKGLSGLLTLLANSTLCVWLMKHKRTDKTLLGVLVFNTALAAVSLLWTKLTPFVVTGLLFFTFSAMVMPILQSLIASEGKAEGFGSNMVMGFFYALKSFGGIVGALVAGFSYAVSPKTPFLCTAAGFGAAAICCILFIVRSKAKHEKA